MTDTLLSRFTWIPLKEVDEARKAKENIERGNDQEQL
jgi:hypothetical protein